MSTNRPPEIAARVLFGQTRRDVLALLLGRPDERFHFRAILRTVGGGSGASQRELTQLVEAGLVRRQVEGRQVYYSANRESSIFPELQGIIEKTTGAADVLRGSLARLIADERIRIALIYGSVARGDQKAGSDVDLLIVGDATLADVVPGLRQAESRLARQVNPTIYPAREFRAKVKQGTQFLRRVLNGPKLFITGDEDQLARLVG